MSTRHLSSHLQSICGKTSLIQVDFFVCFLLCVGQWGDLHFWDLWEGIALRRQKEKKKQSWSVRIRCCGLRHCRQLHITHSWCISWARLYWSRSISWSIMTQPSPTDADGCSCRWKVMYRAIKENGFLCVFFLVECFGFFYYGTL